jgi:hypothetical protein
MKNVKYICYLLTVVIIAEIYTKPQLPFGRRYCLQEYIFSSLKFGDKVTKYN